MKTSTLLSLALITSIAACSSEKASETNFNKVIVGLAKSKVANIKGKKSTADVAVGPKFDRAYIDAQKSELLLVKLDASGFASAFAKTAQNGGNKTFSHTSPASITVNNGIIVATRGLGFDLMSQESSVPTLQLMSTRQGNTAYTRTHEYLDVTSQANLVTYSCTITADGSESIEIFEQKYNTIKLIEQCQNNSTSFKNLYWVQDDGHTIVQTRQYVHPGLGYITTYKLN